MSKIRAISADVVEISAIVIPVGIAAALVGAIVSETVRAVVFKSIEVVILAIGVGFIAIIVIGVPIVALLCLAGGIAEFAARIRVSGRQKAGIPTVES